MLAYLTPLLTSGFVVILIGNQVLREWFVCWRKQNFYYSLESSAPSYPMQDFFFFLLKQLETTTMGDWEVNRMNSESSIITVSVLSKKHDQMMNDEGEP